MTGDDWKTADPARFLATLDPAEVLESLAAIGTLEVHLRVAREALEKITRMQVVAFCDPAGTARTALDRIGGSK